MNHRGIEFHDEPDEDGTPGARFFGLMAELEKRFPTPPEKSIDSSVVPELYYIEQIDKVLADSVELNKAKRQMMNIFTGGKLFPGDNK